MSKKTKKNQWELAERATQEEKELIVAEVEHFEKCCKPTQKCPNPCVWCCKQCPSEELQAKYEELNEESFDSMSAIKSCPSCTTITMTVLVILLVIYFLSN